METKTNIKIIQEELNWLSEVISQVIASYLKLEGSEKNWMDISLPDLTSSATTYATFVKEKELTIFERLLLALVLAPQVKPEILDIFLTKNQHIDNAFTEFGGYQNTSTTCFIPTVQTFYFILCSLDQELRIEAEKILNAEHTFFQRNMVNIEKLDPFLPTNFSPIYLNKNWLDYFICGEKIEMQKLLDLPIKKMTTTLSWDTLFLDEKIKSQIQEISTWMKHQNQLKNESQWSDTFTPGYSSCFYGLSGAGKSTAASLIGKTNNVDVYKVDTPLLLFNNLEKSENNIQKLLHSAANYNWILYFDAADILGNNHEKEGIVSLKKQILIHYFFQQMQDFPGVAIFSSERDISKETSSFQSVLNFKIPNAENRYKLWETLFSKNYTLASDINLKEISKKYKLTAGAMHNVYRNCLLSAIQSNEMIVNKKVLLSAIKKEIQYSK